MKLTAKHKLIPALAMLVVSAVVLTSASYAWFTMSRTVTATGIELTAMAPTNLLINHQEIDGADAADKYAETTIVKETFGTAKLIPSSTGDGINFFAAKDVTAISGGAPTDKTNFLTGAEVTPVSMDTDGYYVDFKLWLKTTGEDDVDVTVAQALALLAKTTASTTDISGAVRFAILNGAGDALCTAATSNTYGLVTPEAATPNAPKTNVDYFTGTNTTKGPITDLAATDGYMGDDTIKINDSNVLFTVAGGGTPYAITLRVWIEGNDKDCITTNAAASFQMAVGFKDATYTEVQ